MFPLMKILNKNIEYLESKRNHIKYLVVAHGKLIMYYYFVLSLENVFVLI